MSNPNPAFDHSAHRAWHEDRHAWANDWKAGRGDIQTMILNVLQEKPMHGYEVIRKLEERSHGMWRPSPGSIYPTLQMLVDQGLIESEEDKGKKTYTLTDEGKKRAKEKIKEVPWSKGNRAPERFIQLRITGIRLMKTMKQIMKHGSDEQFDQARAVINQTVQSLESILDQSYEPTVEKEN